MDATKVAQEHAALLHHLGAAAGVLPLPAPVEGFQEVGELCGIPCWSGIADGAGTKRAVRLFMRRGAVGLLLTDHPRDATRRLAVTVDAVRVTALLQGEVATLPLRRLARVVAQSPPGTPLATAHRVADALDVDAAGRTTFSALHTLLETGIQSLPAAAPTQTRHAWLLLQLTRLLFLRFVESEGWLDGDTLFLLKHIDAALERKRDVQRHLLAPLFFGTLNRPPRDRSRLARSFGRIPFLNGGLFEPHEIERDHAFRLPAEYWALVSVQLVQRTDVTLDHDDLEGRVTPEMLGRVFEGVMAPAERRHDGTFFTPPSLVRAMVAEAMACHLAQKLNRSESDIRAALAEPDPILRRALLSTTVMDLAVGSGAFLVGALHAMHGPGPRNRRTIQHLVTRRLHGVDRNPAAVRIAELRLWLEVLRASRGDSVGHVPPLPNLDAMVRAGDALLDPELGPLGVPMIRRLRVAHAALAGSHGASKRVRLRALRRAETGAFREALGEQEVTIERQIEDLHDTLRAPTLFGDRAPVHARERKALDALHAARRTIRTELRRLAAGSATAPFALTTAYAPILHARGGFDLIVGNPPWVRAEELAATTRDALRARYRWWRTSGGQGFRHLPDLSVAFMERSLALLAPGGTLALLLPAKIATAGYAAVARDALTRRATLHVVADLVGDPRAGFDATTYPLALIASRGPAARLHETRLGLEPHAARHQQETWAGAGPWLLTSPEAHAVVQRLAARHPTLAEEYAPQLGVKTGANAVFLDPPAALARWCRIAVRGRDVRAFRVSAEQRLLWPADDHGEPWPALPPEVAEYLAPFEKLLRRRADHVEGVWWRLFRVRAATARHRVVWGDLAVTLEAATLENPALTPLNSCYLIAAPSRRAARVLTAWLNSSWIRAIARLRAEPAAGGAARFGARAVGGVPWVTAALQHPSLAAPAAEGAEHDAVVADLLTLTNHERAILAPLATRRR